MSLMATQPPSPRRASSGFSFFTKIKPNKDNKQPSPRTLPGRRSTSRSSDKNQPVQPHNAASPESEKRRADLERIHHLLLVEVCRLEDEFVSASKIGRRKEIGQGISSTVKVMQRKRGKGAERTTLYAVKEFRPKNPRDSEAGYLCDIKSEFTIAKSLNHPNIVRTVQLCTSNGRWNQVMEYCDQGDVFGLVQRRYLKTTDRLCIFKQLLRGVDYLHDHGIAHRDLKLENMLMTNEGYIKIADFGIAAVFCGDHPGVASSQGRCGQGMAEPRKSPPDCSGTISYMSPEVLARDKDYDMSKLDVWSCGILFLALFFSGNPWERASMGDIYYARFMEGWKTFFDRFGDATIDENCHPQCGEIFDVLPSDSMRRCILKMLHPDPDRRCTIKDALKDRWVRGIECCSREDTEGPSEVIDVSKACHMVKAKLKVQAKHNHLPPPVKRLPQHKFDMGDGTSRYD
ncbi:hypothetical protein H2200_003740 [Cladophialophora chaetospira]|uniref:Protein kinase domain-containing protein n=1 Tax=Cladophialophora chaetospira TaxID=386627 RepID=A0AA38XES4_9EURO|nr:hypothetical protein H2200_003740 [Cladophialophora chaetospira]